MARRSLFRSPQLESPYFTGDSRLARRSRKPVWAVSSIEGSNPSLSAKQGVFLALCRANAHLQAVADGVEGGSTRDSVGPTVRDFVPSTFPPDVAEFVPDGPSPGELGHRLEAHIGEQSCSFIRVGSMPARSSADCQVATAAHSADRAPQEVVA
jgi:hypothetical protein